MDDPIVPAMEYFLSLEDVPHHAAKLSEILTRPVGTPMKNDREIQWASLCAEMGAICLLGKTLGNRILNIEATSPKTAFPNRTCDILAAINGRRTFFEVKRNAAEEKQTLPDFLRKKLDDLESELPFSMLPQLDDRHYDCSNIDEKLQQIRNHVARFERQKHEGLLLHEATPSPFKDNAFTICFALKSDDVAGCHLYAPVFHFSKYLLGPGEKGADGKAMVPMVQQALLKGADYLMCRVPRWKSWPDILGECFPRLTHTGGKTYFADDVRLGVLSGIVLFARYDDFCIVNNLRARVTNWLRA